MPIRKLVKKLIKKRRTQKKKDNIAAHTVSPQNYHIITDDIPHNATKVIKRLQHAGFHAYLVGGSVRDLLLRIVPKDFDVATDAHPEQIKKLFRNCRLIGRRFRLAHILFHREIIEVATFRAKEKHPSDNQKTTDEGVIIRDNVYGTLEEDAWRRDFSVNALYFDVVKNSLVDYMDGLKDLNNKTLKIIGDPYVRYKEDPVRMLRAIRFAAKLNFTIEPNSKDPILEQKKLLTHVSPSRLFEEILKLFHSGHGLNSYYLLKEHGVFKVLFNQTADSIKVNKQKEKLITETLANTDKRIHANQPVTPAFLFAALLWYPIQDKAHVFQKDGVTPALALDRAIRDTLMNQRQIISIPKYLTRIMREIWLIQSRLINRKGKRAYNVLLHTRFRAGYDFLVIRAKAGNAKPALASWWTKFQFASPEIQQSMVDALLKIKSKDNDT